MKKIVSILIIFVFFIFMNSVYPIFSFAKEENNISSEEKYYSSLHAAIEDANNKTTKNANSNANDGVASLVISNNKATITLIKDYDEENELIIDNDIDFNLNGKNLNLIASNSKTTNEEYKYGFVINKYKTLNIYGEIQGSEIHHEESLGKYFIMFQVLGDININGGKYINNVNDSGAWFINATDTYTHNIKVENIELNTNALLSAFAVKTSLLLNNSNVTLRNNKFTIHSNERLASVIYGTSNSNVDNNKINIYSSNGNGSGFMFTDFSICKINNNKIKVETNEKKNAGIYLYKYCDAEITNNEIEATSENNSSSGLNIMRNSIGKLDNNKIISISEKGIAEGIVSKGILEIDDLDLKVVCREPKNKGAIRH